jgi:hypothetical protein
VKDSTLIGLCQFAHVAFLIVFSAVY